MNFQSIRGFKDLLPPEAGQMAAFEALARRILANYGYNEIRLPTLEMKDLFIKSTGETTDIVEKEMFELEDSGGRRLALRPEGTPGAVRAYLQHHLHQQGGRTKLFYIGSMFRAERPQAGRFREFGQIGAECFGNGHPAADAEAIQALALVLDEAGLKNSYAVHLNNLGDESPDCRPAFRERLKAFLKSVESELCENCRRRMDRNPLRILDCKGDGPKLKDRMPRLAPCKDCRTHYEKLKGLLGTSRGKIEFIEDPSLVRGLDYYTRTVFEFKSKAVGSQDAIAGGGRYDNLIKIMGGTETPAIGWALGIERTLMAISSKQAAPAGMASPIYVAVQSEADEMEKAAMDLLHGLRSDPVRPVYADGGMFSHSLKSQMREAERLGAEFVVIFGEQEFKDKKCIIKNMKRKDVQEVVSIADALNHLRNNNQNNKNKKS